MQDCACFGVMVGMGETYLPAFALAVGMSESAAGLVASLPLVAGGAMQLVSLRAMRWFGSEQRWVVLCAAIQALSFLPLVLAAFYGSISLTGLLLIASVFWASGLASGPAWNTWMESVVPAGVRASYFSQRSRLQQACTLGGLLAAGMLLHSAESKGWPLLGFAAIFGFSTLARWLSVLSLAGHQTDSRLTMRTTARLSAGNGRPVTRSGRRLLTYLVATQACVQISGPFFAPYMLEQLQFSYLQFVLLMAAAFVSRVLAMSQWTRIAKNYGAATLLWIGGIGLIPISALWILSDNIVWLVLIQMLSGVVWAAYELGFFLLFFETLPADRRTKMLTYYNFANTVAMFAGASVGAALLTYFNATLTAYYVLFALSGIGRLFAIGLLFRAELKPVPIHQIAIRVLGLRSNTATLDVPILSSLEPPPEPGIEPKSESRAQQSDQPEPCGTASGP